MYRGPRCASPIHHGETECPSCQQNLYGQLHSAADNERTPHPSSLPGTAGNGIRYAGFWRRLGAVVPDLIIAGLIAFIVSTVLELVKFPYPVPGTLVITFAIFLILYSPLCISSRYQASAGKILFGIIVVNCNGRRLSFSRPLVRELGKYVSFRTLGIGFLLIGFTKKKQGLHDLLAQTVVIDRSEGQIYQRQYASNSVSGSRRLKISAIIIGVCLVFSVVPLVWTASQPPNTVTVHSVVAGGLASAADTMAGSEYMEYSLGLYDTAINLQPGNTEIQVKKLYVLRNMGRIDEVREGLDQLIVRYPNETAPMIFKGDLLVRDGKYEEAATCYEKALAADPNNAKIWVRKGDAYLVMAISDMTEIREMYRNLTTGAGRPASAGSTVPIETFQSTIPYQEAVKCYNKAIELDPLTSIAVSGRILTSTQNLVETYESVLQDMNHPASP